MSAPAGLAADRGGRDDAGAGRELEAFAAEVGAQDPVCVVGGRTHWGLGGLPAGGTREVRAPVGVVSHDPAEMVVRVRAGTPLAELSGELAAGGQMVALDADDLERATVGGVLSLGWSGYLRLRYGPVRDGVLEVRYVDHAGRLVRAGAPLVKNVTGYDLCRLMVGSLGTLGLLGEVVLRCFPLPAVRRWFSSEEGGCTDPFALEHRLYRPGSVLTDGRRTWVCLEGDPGDVSAQLSLLGPGGWQEVAGPPRRPPGERLSISCSELPAAVAAMPAGEWLAEVGVGTVHLNPSVGTSRRSADPRVGALNRAIKFNFDPSGRLNPGRDPMSL